MIEINSSLENLSTDCLELIVELLSAYDIGHLWLTGSLQLQIRLSEQGAAKRFEFSHDPKYRLLWPSLMRSLAHLTTLSIAAYQKSDQGNFRPLFEQLPPKLRHFKFDCNEAAASFLVFLNKNTARFTNLESLSVSSIQNIPDFHVDFSSLSNLTKLYFQLRFPPSKLILPPHLTFLRTKIEKDAEMSPLPSSLTSLSLILPEYQSDWSHLPPHLESLKIEYSVDALSQTDYRTPGEDLLNLPKKLTSLEVTVYKLTCNMASSLPPSLTKLVIQTHRYLSDAAKMEIYAHFPKSLRYLSGSIMPSYLDFGIDPVMLVKSLPRGLQMDLNSIRPGTLAFLPLGTVGIQFVSLQGKGLDDLRHLPLYKNLTKLSCPRLTPEMFSTLPRCLRRLHLLDTTSNLSADQAQQLPPYLEYLQTLPYGADFDAIQHLPRTLELFISKFENSDLYNEAALHIPSGIKYLQLFNTPISKALLANLPRELPALIISAPQQQELESSVLTDTLPRFKNMRRLEIRANAVRFTGSRKLLQCLPKQLNIFVFEVYSSDLEADDHKLVPDGVQFKVT